MRIANKEEGSSYLGFLGLHTDAQGAVLLHECKRLIERRAGHTQA